MSIPETFPKSVKRISAAFCKVLLAIRGSIVYFIWTFGMLSLISGIALQEGVMAGMLVIFGVSALVYGTIGYLGLRMIGYPRFRQYE